MRKFILSIGLMLTVLFVLSACGTEQGAANKEKDKEVTNADKEAKDKTNDAVEITDALGNTVQFDRPPETAGVLNSGDLDILIALGVDVVGRPTANGPVDAALEDITEIGNPHQPNFEKIAQANPHILAAAPSFQQYADNVKEHGTEVVYTQANSVDDILQTITLFGQIFAKETEAEEIVTSIKTEIEEVEKAEAVKTLLVYGAPGTYLAALPNSLTGDLLEKAGGENIASDFKQEDNYPQYASLSIEKIIERNPEVVMLITHGEPEAVKQAFEEEMNENPAWKNLDAVQSGNVFVLPSDLFGTNPGTKITEALKVMQENLGAVK